MKKIVNILITTSIIVLSFGQINAEEIVKKFGDWDVNIIYGDGDPFVLAKTKNNSESELGIICHAEDGCCPYIFNKLSCNAGDNYPALASVDGGFTNITMKCVRLGNNVCIFLLPQSHLNPILSDKKYGIAFGLSGGKFKAAYFSLTGSAKAMVEARRQLRILSSQKDTKSKASIYKDTKL